MMAAPNDEVGGERPVGVWFKPNDRELVDFLYNMVNDNSLRDYYPVNFMDVYGESYWRSLFETSADEDTFYFFTPLKQRTEDDSRISRVAVDGVWKNQQRPKPIRDDLGAVIGSKSNFSFIPKVGFQEPCGTWAMLEYRLEGRYRDNEKNLHPNQYALCRIRKKGRNGSSATYANGRPADYGRPDGYYMIQCFENWFPELPLSPV